MTNHITTAYWLSTLLISALLTLSAASYLFHQATIEGVRALGFPDFFRVQLAILKLVAAMVIVIPMVPLVAKDWAYAGIACFLLTAIVAHIAHQDAIWITLLNSALLLLLLASAWLLRLLPSP